MSCGVAAGRAGMEEHDQKILLERQEIARVDPFGNMAPSPEMVERGDEFHLERKRARDARERETDQRPKS